MVLPRTIPVSRSVLRGSPCLPRTASIPILGSLYSTSSKRYAHGHGHGYGIGNAKGLSTLRFDKSGVIPPPPPTSPSYLLSTRTKTRTFANLSTSNGKSEANLLVDEIEELYAATKDELEIATDSTNSSTIYAPSDRASARDALNQLLSVYTLYTSPELSSPAFREDQQEQAKPIRHGEEAEFGNDQARMHVHGQGVVHGEGKGQQGQKVRGDSEEAGVQRAVSETGTTYSSSSTGSSSGDGDGGKRMFVDVETNYDPTKVPVEVRHEVKRRVERRVKELQAAVEALEERARAE